MRKLLGVAAICLVATACPPPIMRDVLRYAQDTIRPTLVVDTPANRSLLTSSVTFVGTATDSSVEEGDGAGRVDTLTYTVLDHESLDGSAPVDPETGAFSFTIDTSGLRGNQKVTITATDWNGNKTPVDIELVDTGEGPDITITSPAQNSVYLSSVTVSGVVNDVGDAVSGADVESLAYQVLGSAIDGTVAFNGTTGAFSFTFSTVGLNGQIVVRITATDHNGRSTNVDLELLDVGLGPGIDISSPAPYANYQNSVTIDGTVTNRTDPSAADEVQSLTYQVLNYPAVSGNVTFNASTGAFSLTFSTLTPVVMTAQTLVIRFTAKDLNNRTTVLDYSLTEDPAGPYIDLTSPDDGTGYGVIVTLSGSVSNSQSQPGVVSDVASLTYEVNSGTPLFPEGAITYDGTGAFSQQFSTVGISGAMLIRIRATDLHGHVTEQSINLLDNIPGPPVAITAYPTVYSSVSWTELTVSGTVGDSASQIGGSLAYEVAYTGGLAGSPLSIVENGDPDLFSFTLTFAAESPPVNGNLTITVTAIDGSGRDAQADITISDDPVAPYIVRGDMAPDNGYVDVTLSEPAYTDAGGGGLMLSDLTRTFVRNGGAASAVSLAWVSKPDGAPGSALQGGELVVRVGLSVTGSPSGVETVSIQPNTASVYDYVGNPMSVSATTGAVFLMDEAAPAAPGMPDLDTANDTGISATDNITKNTTGLTFSGSGVEPYATLTLYTDNPLVLALGSTTVTSGGTWTLTPIDPLAEGVHNITAVAEDGGGHESPPSTALVLTVDTSSPTAPGMPDLDAFDDTGLATNDNTTRNTSNLTFSISVSEAGTLELFRAGTTSLGTVAATGSGSFDVEPVTLPTGTHLITARLTDAAGNTSAASPATTPSVVVDTTAPTPAPATPDLDPSDDTGTSNTDNITSATTNLTFTGTSGAEAGGRIYLYRAGSTLLGFADTTLGGSWSVSGLTLAIEGTHTITATAMDLAGNESAASTGLSLTIATTPPSAPGAPDLTTDTGTSTTDNLTNNNTPSFNVSTTAAGTVKLYDGLSTEVASLAVGGSGSHTVTTSTLGEGGHSITATFTNAAGTESAHSSALAIQVDTVPPNAPTVPDMTAATDLGTSNSDNETKDTTPDFEVTVDEAGTLDLRRAGTTTIATTSAASSGLYTLTPSSALSQASHSITARLTDDAGNSATSGPLTPVVIDTTAPGAAPSAPNLDAADDSYDTASGGLGSNTDDYTSAVSGLTFTGTGGINPGRINLYRGGTTLIGSVDTTVSAWTVDGVSDVVEGSNSITAKVMDVAGNESSASGALSLTIDTVPPAVASAMVLKSSSDSGESSSDRITNDTTPTITVTVDGTDAAIRLYHTNSVLVGTLSSTTSGGKDITSTALADATYDLTTTRTDIAGNTSDEAESLVLAVTIDTVGAQPDIPDLEAGSDNGPLDDDQITNDTTPGFVITVSEPGTIKLYRALTNQIGSATAATSGSYNITSSTLTQATHSITAKLTDKAGNESVASTALSVEIDTTSPGASPSAPDLLAADDSGDSSADDLTKVVAADLTFEGTGGINPGRITLYRAGTTLIGYVDTTGSAWTVDGVTSVAEGANTVTARVMDMAGNESTASTGLALTIDTSVTAPDTPALQPASDTDPDGDFHTQVTTPTFDITVYEAGTIELFEGANSLGTTTANDAGTFSITSSALAVGGPYSITAKITDVAGNLSGASTAYTLTVDP